METRQPSPLTGKVSRVLVGERFDPPPIWLMRQAGRYLPEYRDLRQNVNSFLDLCFNPHLASKVTLQPIERFDFDAAILFSDILVIPHALGQSVRFVEGEGPRLDPLDEKTIAKLESGSISPKLDPVYETVASVRKQLDSDKTLIGFCGAPWTVATYMIAGRTTRDQAPTRLFSIRHPEEFQALIDRLVSASVEYLIGQLKAGANVIQIFDSWSGVLSEEDFQRWCIAPTRKIIEMVREAVPEALFIGFPKGAGLMIERYAAETGVDGIGIDWTVPLEAMRTRLNDQVALQGNLDPLVLLAGGNALDHGIDRILNQLSDGRFIFNLGHGILPETPIAHVERLIKRIRAG